MTNSILTNNAIASTKGTIYQLYVAVQKCFEMLSGQKVLIERCGDVTISGKEQIETKHYEGPLNDNHINFWKTLKNWMQVGFDESRYSTLILYTTQEFGKNARIAGWNKATVDQRITMLEDIRREAEDREMKRKDSGIKVRRIPESLELQRYVLDVAKQTKLHSIASKYFIASSSPLLDRLYCDISDQYCKGILAGKRDDFLNSLLGYVISPSAIQNNSWEITFEQFEVKVGELITQYCRETRRFPTKYLETNLPPKDAEMEMFRTRLFVNKIKDIEYHEVITKAICEYIITNRTVLEEFQEYKIPPSQHEAYEKEVLSVFEARYRSALRNVSDVIKDSKDFYDQIISDEPPSFSGFDKPPRVFRNGVIHMNCDDHEKSFKWRLEKGE